VKISALKKLFVGRPLPTAQARHERLRRAAVSGLGAATTGLVMIVPGLTRFADGAWIVLIVAGRLIVNFVAINRHYGQVAGQLSLDSFEAPPPIPVAAHAVSGPRGSPAGLRR
jgi:hypothetical protein